MLRWHTMICKLERQNKSENMEKVPSVCSITCGEHKYNVRQYLGGVMETQNGDFRLNVTPITDWHKSDRNFIKTYHKPLQLLNVLALYPFDPLMLLYWILISTKLTES